MSCTCAYVTCRIIVIFFVSGLLTLGDFDTCVYLSCAILFNLMYVAC